MLRFTLLTLSFLNTGLAQCVCTPASNQLSYVVNVPPGYQQARNICCFPSPAGQSQQAQRQNQVLVYYGTKAPWTLPNAQQVPGVQPYRDTGGNIIAGGRAPNSAANPQGSGYPSTNNPAISVYPVVAGQGVPGYLPTATPYPQASGGYTGGQGIGSTTPYPPVQGSTQAPFQGATTQGYGNQGTQSYLQPGQPGQFQGNQQQGGFSTVPPGQQYSPQSNQQGGYQGSSTPPPIGGVGYNAPNTGFYGNQQSQTNQQGFYQGQPQEFQGGANPQLNEQGAPFYPTGPGPQIPQGQGQGLGGVTYPQGQQGGLGGEPYSQGQQGYTGQPSQFGGQSDGYGQQGVTQQPGFSPGYTGQPGSQGFTQGYQQGQGVTQAPPGYQDQGFSGQPGQQGYTSGPQQGGFSGQPYTSGPQGQQGFTGQQGGQGFTQGPQGYNDGQQALGGQPYYPDQQQGFTQGPQGYSQGATQAPPGYQDQGFSGQPGQQGYTSSPNQMGFSGQPYTAGPQGYDARGVPNSGGVSYGGPASDQPLGPTFESPMQTFQGQGQLQNEQGNPYAGQTGQPTGGYNNPNTQYMGTTSGNFNDGSMTTPGPNGAIPPFYEGGQSTTPFSSTGAPYGASSTGGYGPSSTPYGNVNDGSTPFPVGTSTFNPNSAQYGTPTGQPPQSSAQGGYQQDNTGFTGQGQQQTGFGQSSTASYDPNNPNYYNPYSSTSPSENEFGSSATPSNQPATEPFAPTNAQQDVTQLPSPDSPVPTAQSQFASQPASLTWAVTVALAYLLL